MKKLLIAYDSGYGSTGMVAEDIKKTFMERNHTSSYYIKQLKKLIPDISPLKK